MRLPVVGPAITVLLAISVASATDRPAVAVLDLTAGPDLSKSELSLLSDRLRIELFKAGAFRAIERERVDAILEEHEFSASGRVATECVLEVGELIGADHMVAGSVGRIGSVHTINVRMIDVETGTSIVWLSETVAVRLSRCSPECCPKLPQI